MKKLEALRCVEVTTPRQRKNGTRVWRDPMTNCQYASYPSGYVRRIVKGFFQSQVMYPLNKRYWGDDLPITYVLIHDEEEREDLMAHAVINYRNNTVKAEPPQGLGPVEQVLLNQLNMKAMLVIELENILQRHKLTVDHNVLCELEVNQLIKAIKSFDDNE